ncbi:S-adenosyl-L-methionine-dependent methyltransferase [Auricularia subglabra TFB-10046 SS5]|nr:S-adenosyl-L-methionine-dependent methyltransferase [Auricularia subglabra TFB-10046 SS5]
MSSTTPNIYLVKDHWASSDIGARYRQSEKLTSPASHALLEQSGVLDATKRGDRVRLLDNACGTGNLSSAFHAAVAALGDAEVDYQVTCADFSEGMIKTAQERAAEEGWKNTEFNVADAQDTKLPSNTYTHVLTSLGFGIFPSSDAALNEVDRELVPGGTLGITTWHYLGWPVLLQRGLELAGSPLKLPSMLGRYKANSGYDWSSVDVIEGLLKARGYTDIKVTLLPTKTKFSKAEIIDGDNGKTSLKMIMSLVSAEDRAKWENKVLPALAENWDNMFKDSDGLSTTEMTAIVTTAKKAA